MAVFSQYITLIDYNAGTLPVYVGSALSGTATSDAGWSINKITYDGNSNPLTVKIAGGSTGGTNFSQIWDNRATLTYS